MENGQWSRRAQQGRPRGDVPDRCEIRQHKSTQVMQRRWWRNKPHEEEKETQQHWVFVFPPRRDIWYPQLEV